MKFGSILLILFVFAAFPVLADEAVSAETAATTPAPMTDEELASYITGRLKPALEDEGYAVTQACGESGCAVVIQ